MKEQDLTKTQGIKNPMVATKDSIKPRLLTAKEAAVYLGRSILSIRELVWNGSLPIVRVGRRIHFDVVDLDKWVEQHKTRYTY